MSPLKKDPLPFSEGIENQTFIAEDSFISNPDLNESFAEKLRPHKEDSTCQRLRETASSFLSL